MLNEERAVEEDEQRKKRCLILGTHERQEEAMVTKNRLKQKERMRGTDHKKKQRANMTKWVQSKENDTEMEKDSGVCLTTATQDQRASCCGTVRD